jgi:RNA polymerase sigma factor (TIGR02999 family)
LTDLLWDQLYDELQELACRTMARLGPGQTLQPAALVNEVYLRLVSGRQGGWDSRAHFLGAARRAMRNVLVDQIRARNRIKRGADLKRVPESYVAFTFECEDRFFANLVIGEALTRLEAYSPRMTRIVMLRFIVGLTIGETASILGVSTATVERDWRDARAWLYQEVSRGNRGNGPVSS